MGLGLLDGLFRSIRVAVLIFRTALGEMPVLAILTPQIATGTSEAQSEVAGDKMIKGRLFNRPNIYDRGFALNDRI